MADKEELFDLVDEQDNVIGTELRSVVHSNGLLHRAVYVWVFRPDGALLVQRRSPHKKIGPGQLDLSVAEHLQPGESYLQGAVRGLAEELGIAAEAVQLAGPLAPTHRRELHQGAFHDVELVQSYRLDGYTGAVQIDEDEVVEAQWVQLPQLRAHAEAHPEEYTQWFLDEVRSLGWFGAEAAAGRDDAAQAPAAGAAAAAQQAGQPAADLSIRSLQFRPAVPACRCSSRLGTPNTLPGSPLRLASRSSLPGRCAAAMKQHRGALCLLLAAVAVLCCRPAGADTCLDEQAMQTVIDGALEHLQALADRRERPDGSGGGEGPSPLAATLFPNSTDRSTGLYQGSKASKWTSGYLAGCYWRAYDLTGDAKWARLAEAELPGLAKVAGETDNHKVSHIFDSAYSEALAAGAPGADVKQYQKVLQRAAASLAARYNDKVKAIQSWNDIGDPEFEVIIDSMASLKIMWEAAQLPGGKQEWADIALQHARTVAKEVFREDGSTYHVVQFDPETGEVVKKRTHQGYRDDSTWSRGQAWAVVGYTHAYNATRDPQLLATAQIASDVFLQRLAEEADGVPLWDFDVPADGDQAWKDTSAAAIAASGLARLGQLTGSQNYTDAAAALVAALAEGYLGWEGPQPVEALLRNGTFSVPGGHHSTGLIWGDWYFLDALTQLLPLANATCMQ